MSTLKIMLKKLTLSLAALLVIVLFFLAGDTIAKSKPKIIRVKLTETRDKLRISPYGSLQIKCYKKSKTVAAYEVATDIAVSVSAEGLILLDDNGDVLEYRLDKIGLDTKRAQNRFRFNGKPFRGNLQIHFIPGSRTQVAVNLVGLEEYLLGVVPLEMGKKLITDPNDVEALKAQAICARTYSLAKLGQYPNRPFDLEATVADQVYGGMEVEEEIISQAVRQTRGEVILYKDNFINAYYHANCGGSTEYVQKVWENKPEADYLVPVADDTFCVWGTNYLWQQSWNKAELEDRINTYLKNYFPLPEKGFGELLDLQLTERLNSGRAKALKIFTQNSEYELKSDQIRWVFRKKENLNSILPSTLFDLQIFKDSAGVIDSVVASGKGNGHGVGMCQIGALGLARAGYAYQEIIQHYYPGTEVVKYY